MAYSKEVQGLFNLVNKVYKSTPEKQLKFLELWTANFHANYNVGFYDLAYEYIAMHELLLFKKCKIGDEFRLLLWRMFVMDFRRAFSDYEYRLMHR